jgi:ATP-dependent DNA ligase
LHGGLEPQLAHHLDTIPAASSCAGGCWFEPKWDGFRALAYIDNDRGVVLESRRRKIDEGRFPGHRGRGL